MMHSVVQLNILPKLLVNQAEAAEMCGIRGLKKFLSLCPVTPVDMGDGKCRYHVPDLECWIESKKVSGVGNKTDDQLLAELT